VRKRVQEALQALREGFQEAGTPITDATLDFVAKALKSPRFLELLSELPKQLTVASVVAGVLSAAGKNKQPEEKWKRDLEKVKRELPYMVRPELRAALKAHFKGLPKKPGTGRHRLLNTARERRKACDLVSKYNRAGESFRTAYENVAAELNCSARTIQRTWQQRRKRSTNRSHSATTRIENT
jgi:ribosomal protein L12E/L44/L45/RPP1/RPP2